MQCYTTTSLLELFLWLLPRRQVATMSSRCGVSECPLGARGSLGCHAHAKYWITYKFLQLWCISARLLDRYLSGHFSFNVVTKLVSNRVTTI